MAALLALEWANRSAQLMRRFFGKPAAVRWAAALALLFLLILFGKYNESPAFIYFQF